MRLGLTLRFATLPVACCAALLAVAACSGGDAASTTTTTVPTTATTTTLPPLVDDYWSGFGFYLGAADQTAGLFVEFRDTRAAAEGNIPDVSVLPGGRWEAEVRIGSDLFAFLVGSTSGFPRVDEA
jgi:hypothetical protein